MAAFPAQSGLGPGATLAQVMVPVADVRLNLNAEWELNDQALYGEWLQVKPTAHRGWLDCVTPRKMRGVIRASEVRNVTLEPTHRVVRAATVYASTDMRTRPIMTLPPGSRVCSVGASGGHIRVADGWIPEEQLVASDYRPRDWVATLLPLEGLPYLWGAYNGLLHLDCSGLVCLGLDALDITVAHNCATMRGDIRDLAEAGHAALVEYSKTLGGLNRGDLVFFEGHVGVMVDHYRILHATWDLKRVVIEPLFEAIARREAQQPGRGTILAVWRINA